MSKRTTPAERRLWLAVLIQVMIDYRRSGWERSRIRAWLASPDAQTVCDLAGARLTAVRQNIKRCRVDPDVIEEQLRG